jgi:uncharacterized membrane protein YedE/YeeE
MYGIIGLTVAFGIPIVAIIKAKQLKDYSGQEIVFKSKSWSIPRYLIGGAVFGLGWALSGACPGPIVVNMGVGYLGYAVVLVSAVLGTLLYGVIRDKLPH